jgi:hypothetical protein
LFAALERQTLVLEAEVYAATCNLRLEVNGVLENVGRKWNWGRKSRQVSAG